jgi:integrase
MSGLRLNAALGLRWDQVNLGKSYIYVEPGQVGWKGFTGVMPISDYVADLLRERYVMRKSQEWVFPKRTGDMDEGSPHMTRVSDSLAEVCESACIRCGDR